MYILRSISGADPGFQVRGRADLKKCAKRREERNVLGYFVIIIGYYTLLYSYNFNPIKNNMVVIVFRN
jgi:hypothetical protein